MQPSKLDLADDEKTSQSTFPDNVKFLEILYTLIPTSPDKINEFEAENAIYYTTMEDELKANKKQKERITFKKDKPYNEL